MREGREVGELLEEAAGRLVRGEALPAVDLLDRLDLLRDDWDQLLSAAERVRAEAGGPPAIPPDPDSSLADAVAFIEAALAAHECRADREAVLARLSKVTRLEAVDGVDVPGLATLRDEARDLARRIREAADPDAVPEFDSIAGESHPYCQLLALVEPSDDPSVDKIDLALECREAFGREVAAAAAKGRFTVAQVEVGEAADPLVATTECPSPEPEGGQDDPAPPRASVSKGNGPKTGSLGPQPPAGARPDLGLRPRRLSAKLRVGPPPPREWLAPDPRPAAGSRVDLGSLFDPACPTPGSNLRALRITPDPAGAPDVDEEPSAPDVGPDLVPQGPSAGERPSSDEATGIVDEAPAPMELSPVEPAIAGPSTLQFEPASEPDEEPSASEPDASEESAMGGAPASAVADPEEILVHCRRGDFLGASLLAAGRAFAGLPAGDPGVEALLVAHHTANGSPAAPWPDWAFEPEAALVASEGAPESARLVLLSALHQLTRGGGNPIPSTVKEALLTAFNSLPESRTWLDDLLEAVGIPGLWEQVCRPGATRVLDVYKEARSEFMARYDLGLQHRSHNASYTHRQDHYISRLPATRALHDYLRPDEPGTLGHDARRQIEDLLRTEPEAITEEWLRGSSRPTGGIRLKGSQRPTLIKHAAEYLGLMNRSWRAAEALRQSGPPPGEVERRRERFLATLPTVREQAHETVWEPLFAGLTEGLLP